MRAIVQRSYGGPEVLALAEVEAPVPADDEVLIRVAAVAVSVGDVFLLRGEPRAVRLAYGLRRPKHAVIGRDVAGVVEAVGAAVTRFRVGDAVFGESDQGGFAELVAVPERFVAARPVSVDAAHAAAVVVSGTTALQGLRLAGVTPGQHVLVNGASGGVGGFAVQLAKAMGAEVTGVASTDKLDMVRALGVDHVLDYRKVDYTREQERYDWIVDPDAHHPILKVRRVLKPGGVYVSLGGTTWPIIRNAFAGPLLSIGNDRWAGLMTWWKPFNPPDVDRLKELIAAGQLKPVIDRRYLLSEVVDALRRVDDGHARGKVVITMDGPAEAPRT
jgi:NADPH:quinone reductase-like Zn-dependent oxidoreductase